jgi:hypothetical protein
VGIIYEDFETGDFSKYPWTFDGNANWIIEDETVYEGSFSARSGSITDLQESVLLLEMDVLSEGEISFYKKVSCEDDPGGTGYDYLAFYIDDDEQGRWDSEVEWSRETYTVDAGMHTFKWLYYKDPAVSSGEDCAWIDYIVLPPVDNGLPLIFISQESIELTMAPDDSQIEPLLIANIGGGSLDYSIEILEDPVSWLSLSPASGSLNGGEQAEIELLFNSENLEEDTYSCTILVTDNITGETEIPVTLIVDASVGVAETEGLSNSVSIFPNPFTHETTIHFNVAGKTGVSLDIYNSKGEIVKTLLSNSPRDSGKHSIRWDGTNQNGMLVPAGIYFYKLSSDKEFTGRMVLTR